MRLLVTGGAGYIGSHAVRRLVADGHEVVVFDNLEHGHRGAVHKQAELVTGDLGAFDLVELLRSRRLDAVLHFAAFIEVGESVVDPLRYYRNNFANALNLLTAMRQAGVTRIVFSSTAAVYGNPVRTPIDEDHPCEPVNPYGRSKRMVELALADFAAAYGFGSVALRYFNVAGAAADGSLGEDHHPESHLIPRILAGAGDPDKSVSIFGTDWPTPDGTCIRDYVHVDDLADAHALALRHLSAGSAQTFNVGSQSGFSVREVIEACRRVTGKPIRVVEAPRRAGDPATLVADSNRLRSELGWTPRHTELDTMVRHAWNWRQAHPAGYR